MTRDERRDCNAIVAALLDHVLASAPDELDRDLRDHLRGCSSCRAEYAALEQGAAGLPPAGPAIPPSVVRRRVRRYARASVASSRIPRKGLGLVRSRWRLALAGSGLAIAVTFAIIIATPIATPPIAERADTAPMFEALDVATGAMRSFEEFKGKPVLLNFWATWCLPCESEMDSMERLYRRFRDEGFVVLAISVDRESRHKVRQWVEGRGLTFPVLQDAGGEVERRFRTVGVPESFVIDRTGTIVLRVPGPRAWDDPEHSAVIRDLLDHAQRDRS